MKINGKAETCQLLIDPEHRAKAQDLESDRFDSEKKFRMLIVPAKEKGDLFKAVASIEGCFLNKPFNVTLYGQY